MKIKKSWLVIFYVSLFAGIVLYQIWGITHPGHSGTHFDEFSGQKIISPEKSKFAQIMVDSLGGERRAQVFVMFGYPKSSSGGGVFSAKYKTGDVNADWANDNKLKISYPADSHVFSQDSTCQFFKNKVEIFYEKIEYQK